MLVPAKDYGTFRLMFTLRQLPSPGSAHRPCFVFFGMPRDSLNNDALGGIQFQAPYNSGWDYRPGKNNSGGGAFTKVGSGADAKTWAMCEFIADMATSSAKMACCNTGGDGDKPCRSSEIVRWKEAGWARKPRPWGFQIHNTGLYDEYKNVVIEEDPESLDFITTGL
jgi:hypothetical protein